jgi:ABC-type Mn2+/Zn2+ transport system ATPase subunit
MPSPTRLPQEDNFVATMTTSETLNFYASIILPSSQAKAERKQRVADVLAAMGLKHRQQSLVGGTLPGGLMLRGLSGGERKRLSIAAGNLATPSIIFLDEPTSGLDSFAALTVMGYLQRMARDKGHAVIASIHQPRSAIWCMFEKVRCQLAGACTPACGTRRCHSHTQLCCVHTCVAARWLPCACAGHTGGQWAPDVPRPARQPGGLVQRARLSLRPGPARRGERLGAGPGCHRLP